MPVMHARRASGFTLMEILAAMVLLSLLLLAAWSGIRTAVQSVRSGQRFVARIDALRAAQDFMRRELAQAISEPWAAHGNGSAPVAAVFTGGPEQVRYVAALPGYLGRLGPQLQTLKLVPHGDGYQLQVSFALLPPDGSPPKPLGKPQVLLSGIRSGHFSYRGRDSLQRPTGWLTRWNDTGRTPVLVRLDLKLVHGDWPLFVAPVRVDSHAVGNTDALIRHILRPLGGRP